MRRFLGAGRRGPDLRALLDGLDGPVGDLVVAGHDLDRLIERERDPALLEDLAERARRNGDLKWAIRASTRRLQLAPDDGNRLVLARDLIWAQHFEEADRVLNLIADAEVGGADRAHADFQLATGLGHLAKAKGHLVRLSELAPDRRAEAEADLARAMIGAGAFNDARALITEALAEAPNDARLLVLQVRLVLIHEGPAAALEALRALGDQIDPGSLTYRTTYASILIDRGRFNEATDLLMEWIEATPRAIELYWLLMVAAGQCDRVSEMSDLVDQTMVRYPSFDALAEIARNLAIDQNDWARAKDLSGAVRRSNSWSHLAGELSGALQRPTETDPDKAYADLRADGVRFTGPTIMFALFNYYYRAAPDRLDTSLSDLRQLLPQSMGDPGILAIFLRLLIARDRDDEAKAMFEGLPKGLRACASLAPFAMYFDARAGRHDAARDGWQHYLAESAHMALNARSSYPDTIAFKYTERKGDVLLFLTVFNGIEFVDWFLDYYRSLGVAHFFVVDNGSTDGTYERLSVFEDVSLFRNDGSFSASACGVFWTNHLMRRYGVGHWCFHVDMDEAFVFPGMDEGRDLTSFLAYLDDNDFGSVPALMLDIYPERLSANVGDNPFELSTYIDTDYRFIRNEIPPYHYVQGGIRSRLSGRSLLMTKAPLVRMTPDLAYIANNHQHTHCRFSDVTGALLHYKFIGDFAGRVDEAIDRNEHFMGARFYKALRQSICADAGPEASLLSEYSVRYTGPRQLLDMGLLRTSDTWSGKAAQN